MAFAKKGDLNRVHSHVKHSFSNVKKDTEHLFSWVEYLNKKIAEQDAIITEQNKTLVALHNAVSTSFLTPKEVKQFIDNHFAVSRLNALHNRIHHLHEKLDVMASLHDAHHSRFSDIKKHLENLSEKAEKKGTMLKEKLIRNITRNSKAYVKNAIFNYIKKYHEISALNLKELVVNEQQICSKSSFYRLLQELEDEEKVSVVKNGKQKTYFLPSIQT